jgi:hypothetical protein
MATRVGIELSPAACRIVEVEAGRGGSRNAGETRVVSFAVLPPSGPETEEKLELLRRQRATVIVWGEPTEHRQVMVTGGSYESMRTEALAALNAAGLQTRGMWADITPAPGPTIRMTRRPVVVSLASGTAAGSALRTLVDAGIRVRAVTTPAAALGSLAHLRRPLSVPGAIEAYIALEETVTCIALVKDGALMAGRDFAWGYLDEAGEVRQPRRREDIAKHLADELAELFAGLGSSGAVSQVCICGGLDELRSMTVPLMERLDVEVETLDSLFGIDAARLPESGDDEFRERSAELRLAWAVAADWPPAINLLRARHRQASKAMLGRAAVVAGVAAGLGVGWAVQRSQWWQATSPKPVARTVSKAPAPAVSKPPASVPPPVIASKAPVTAPPPVMTSKPRVTAPPPVIASKPQVTAPPPVMASKAPVTVPPPVIASKAPVTAPPPVMASKAPAPAPPPVMANKPPVPVRPPPVMASKAPVPAPPPMIASKPPVPVRPPPVIASKPPAPSATAREAPTRQVEAQPAVRPAEPASIVRPPVPARVATTAPSVRSAPPPAAKARPAPEPELPFDAVLGTILYSPERRLAIIDGRIVGPGDEVRGARVIDITPGAVLLRDAQGRLRRLGLGPGVR